MDSDELTQLTQGTQGVVDPRRYGRNNSGLSDEDVSDVMCILHPSTPAAYRLVAETAVRAPQHVLQNYKAPEPEREPSPAPFEEQQTFILAENHPSQALDLAFRFSTTTKHPHLGFMFGRNDSHCDIVVASDAHKRVSNMHFIIYMNESAVLMLKDMSTNGTMVDDALLKRKSTQYQKQRMLNNGSVINILSEQPEESLRFIVRFPSRQGHEAEYERKVTNYMERMCEATDEYVHNGGEDPMLILKRTPGQHRRGNSSLKTPLVRNNHGMHWNGGDRYNVVGQIGKGAFASVYQLATKGEGHFYAAKELEKRRFMKNGILDRKLENEMQIMQSINHTSIVQYREYQDVKDHLYIIMEFVPCGDLQQHLTEHGRLPEHVGKSMAAQVLDALDYLHTKNITHRDIKPDNILLAHSEEENFVIKLSDFGLSKVVNNNDTFLKTFCGTLLYCAPEVFPHYDAHVGGKGTKRPRKPPPQQFKKFHSYSQAVDIWSFGAVLWYSLCLRPPFEGVADNTGRGMFDKIMMTPLDETDLVERGVSDEAVALLIHMLNTDPTARPSAEDCLRHEWFGGLPVPVRPERHSTAAELGAIAEDPELDGEFHQNPDVAGLSLDERVASHNSEVSLNSEDMNFFDPRQSKRFKPSEARFPDNEEENFLDSSSEIYQEIPIMRGVSQPQGGHSNPFDKAKPAKLFGEISQSDLQASAFGRHANEAVGTCSSSHDSEDLYSASPVRQNTQRHPSKQYGDSPSLEGAESLVRDMNMQCDPEREQPGTPDSFEHLSQDEELSQETPVGNFDQTPRPAAFSRQIKLPIPASFYYVPDDPSTHNLEYASKVSGHDFASDPVFYPNDTSLPPTENPSAEVTQEIFEDEAQSKDQISGTAEDEQAEDDSASPMYGKLVSTKDSVARITLPLNQRHTTWGRAPENTYVYHDSNDTRVARTALAIFFHAPGIEMLSEGEDFTKLPGLYCGVITHGSIGVRINSVQLKKGTSGKQPYGKLHTGDEIEIFSRTSGNGKGGLKFKVEVYCGDGIKPRPSHEPRFTVEKGSTSSRSKRKGKNKENEKGAVVVVEEDSDAAAGAGFDDLDEVI
ncbi:uncharacterized protein RCC_03088 [Lecanosticta acicola]|uniref:non-specific serine/threonine protein kinase n=1 Tax=Lecanosticta acicola TaxID=111012 RepID=A0AAI9E8R9_9PEZI|nr:uncharacterized protein RCC_03088 [Lecanosticta acicola]